MSNYVVFAMAAVGIGGGFAGLIWGWMEGERESALRRALRRYADGMPALAQCAKKFGVSTKELSESFEKVSALVVAAGTIERLKLTAEFHQLAPGSVLIPVYESEFLDPGTVLKVPQQTFSYRLDLGWPVAESSEANRQDSDGRDVAEGLVVDDRSDADADLVAGLRAEGDRD